MEKLKQDTEQRDTFILETYREGNLYTGLKDANLQQSLNKAIYDPKQGPIRIMISPENKVIIFDGNHRAASKILEGESPPCLY